MLLDTVRHPAKYSDVLLDALDAFLPVGGLILDPFGGVGKVHALDNGSRSIIAGELEHEWARQGCDVQHNAIHLPFADCTFDAAVTSPTYGNRMADSFTDHQPEKKYRRNTYTHAIGRKLHPDNTGAMQWGDQYREMHRAAWLELWRVLKPGGVFVLNVSDHIRAGKRQYVCAWHVKTLVNIGFDVIGEERIETPRQRYGQNGKARVDYELVAQFVKVEQCAT